MITRRNPNIIQIRDDITINVNKIDIIVKTKTNPKDNSTFEDDMNIIYLTNSKYTYILCTKEDYDKYVKPKL